MVHIASDTRGHQLLATNLRQTRLELFPDKETPKQTVSLDFSAPRQLFLKCDSSFISSACHDVSFPCIIIYHPLDSPHPGHKVSAQHGIPNAKPVGRSSAGPLRGVHGNCFDTRETAHGFLEWHNIVWQGHSE
ncbi:hypothetical protein XENOCAPTIV_026505 [Xenoophorus captivus]|uniref:Uncharacterized protein n=1 Tax=Xenoophorus captivus TaxID=1517983 RepID=A0ABV0QXP5_9TELE